MLVTNSPVFFLGFFLHSARTFRFGLFLFIKFKPSTHSSKAGSVEMSKTPLETHVYIIVKCVTCCCAVSTQVSHTISRGSCSPPQNQTMTTQGKQILPANAEGDTQGPPSLFCCRHRCCCCSTLEYHPETWHCANVCARFCATERLRHRKSAENERNMLCHFQGQRDSFDEQWSPTVTSVWRNRWPPPLPPLSQAIQRSADASVSAVCRANTSATRLESSRHEKSNSSRMFGLQPEAENTSELW